MSRKPRRESRSRREFLKELVAAGGATAVAAVSGQALAESPGKPAARSGSRGYRLTPHISTYYQKARI